MIQNTSCEPVRLKALNGTNTSVFIGLADIPAFPTDTTQFLVVTGSLGGQVITRGQVLIIASQVAEPCQGAPGSGGQDRIFEDQFEGQFE